VAIISELGYRRIGAMSVPKMFTVRQKNSPEKHLCVTSAQ
jgi:hypothetical protein